MNFGKISDLELATYLELKCCIDYLLARKVSCDMESDRIEEILKPYYEEMLWREVGIERGVLICDARGIVHVVDDIDVKMDVPEDICFLFIGRRRFCDGDGSYSDYLDCFANLWTRDFDPFQHGLLRCSLFEGEIL